MTLSEDEFDKWFKSNNPSHQIFKNGYPDRLMFDGKNIMGVEIKTGRGGLSKTQRKTLDILNRKIPMYIARKTDNGFILKSIKDIRFNEKFDGVTRPVRLTRKSDIIVREIMKIRGINNVNTAINWMIINNKIIKTQHG